MGRRDGSGYALHPCSHSVLCGGPTSRVAGQTLGKRIAHIKVLREDGTAAGPLCLVIRQVLVGFLLEGSGFVVARHIREMAVLATRVDVNYYWEIAGMVITLISGILALVLPSRRALHDYLARTRVVPAEGHPLYRG